MSYTASPNRQQRISIQLETLIHQHPQSCEFDVVVVGSGYGGAIAAAEFSNCEKEGKKLDICVLERGNEYQPGQFPAKFSEFPGHVRFNTWFDV